VVSPRSQDISLLDFECNHCRWCSFRRYARAVLLDVDAVRPALRGSGERERAGAWPLADELHRQSPAHAPHGWWW